ncbi:MAG: ABC transporter ATP-binding protein [Planctomycetes bacterium]|nr:ABC transporter ATP-binding protein [Planctomycetota bacterium]
MIEDGQETNCEIKLVDVHKTYRMGEVDVPVLRGIDLEVRKAELTVVCGVSGSGKSTLLNMIGGIDRPSRGEIWLDDDNIAGLSDGALTEYRRRSVGFVFQFYNLVPTLTALENIQVSTEIADQAMDPAEALKLVDLADRMDHFPAQLSGGQQQRVAIARALAKRPRLMLCDEPTGALDFNTSKLVLALLTRLNEELGATIVIVTHAIPISQLAHRVIQITDGKVTVSRFNESRKTAEEISW